MNIIRPYLMLCLFCALPLTAQQGDVFKEKDVKIINPGASLNHEGLDYAPAISPDGKTLFFVSNRPGSKLAKDGKTLSHDFWSAIKNTRLDTVFIRTFNIDTLFHKNNHGLNTSFNEGVPAISANRRMMFFTGCDRPDVLRKKVKVDNYDKEYECDIYVVELQPNGQWGIPRNLGTAINSEEWDGHPSLSPTGDRLYFASTRPGGFGDADIWYSDYDYQRRTWSKPQNAGKTINTSGRDWSPFIAPNNRELFFASDGHSPNYGGTDFYVSLRTLTAKDPWSKPRNIGKPINTDANEAFISSPAQRDVLYFSSQRTDIPGFQGNYDVFMAFVPKSSFSLALPISGGVMDACTGLPTSATVIVYNPMTKRQFRDTLDTQRHTSFETVINDFDFLPPGSDKPVDTLRIQLFAENIQYGRLFQELMIIRPQPSGDGTLTTLDVPPIILRYGEKPNFSVTPQAPDQATFQPRTAMKKILASGYNGLVMEEIVSISVNRILNYVFFDEGSSQIPPRYHKFHSAKEAHSFDEERLKGETIDKYYHVLNITGFRLQKFPKSVITIVGCNDNVSPKEKNDNVSPKEKTAGLSKNRAQAVFDYLRNVWGISEKRMKIQARDLPLVPSNRDDSLGIMENRRVEIVCDDWEIIKPVVDRTPLLSVSAPALELALPQAPPPIVDNKAIVRIQNPTSNTNLKRRFVVTRAGKPWRSLDISSTTTTIVWNWKNDKGEYPPDDTPLDIRISVLDAMGRECLSGAQTIPVKRISTEDKKREQSADKTLERYNLIMFPFDKSDVGPMNARIIREYVLPRLLPNSETLVVGHTDVIGEADYNQRLSQSRGNNAKEEIARLSKFKIKSLESSGVGEENPLFLNSLPEGRFYNRTVQVIIETPIVDIQN